MCALALCAGLRAAQEAVPPGPPGAPAPQPPEYAHLAELAERGLDGELVAAGLPLLAKGGALEGDAQSAALVARALFNAGREDEAFQLLDRARPADAADTAALALMRARLLLQRDRLKEALSLLVAEPGAWDKPRFPGVPDNQLLLGRALVRSDRYDLAEPALDAFVRAAPLHPEGPAAWHMLFDCALKRGDQERAKTCRAEEQRLRVWQELLTTRRLQVRRDPSARLPRLGLALLWMDAGELGEARKALDELLARFPEDAEGWLHMGEVERKQQHMAEAERAYGRALELDPEEQRARYNLALLHRQAGRTAEARSELERLVASEAGADARFLGAHLVLARLYVEAGEQEKARERYAVYAERGGKEGM